jgi:hypothetical protein
MEIKKAKIEKHFLVLAFLFIATFILYSIFQWIKKSSSAKELMKSTKVSIIDVGYSKLELSNRKTYVPVMIIELENKGEKTIKWIHIRVGFNSENKKLCLISRDLKNLKPKEKRKVFLKCREKSFFSPYRGGILRKTTYTLEIYPEGEKMSPLRGEIKFEK